MLRGISQFVHTRNDWSVLFGLRDAFSDVPGWLHDWDGDGVISRRTTASLVDSLQEKGIPLVDLTDGGPAERTPPAVNRSLHSIRADDVAIGRMAADYLVELGHRSFAFCGHREQVWSTRRRVAFRERLIALGFGLHDCYESPWKLRNALAWKTECQQIAGWIQSLPKPIGVMAAFDVRGQDLIAACDLVGVSVPEEVSVIGVDDDDLVCELCSTPLTSIKSNMQQVGYLAAETLSQLMMGETPQERNVLVPPNGIAKRQSTDTGAIEDKVVVEALRYIRENACLQISVKDVVRDCDVSRSTLERRMRKAIGRTPSEQIRYVQLSRVRELLVGSTLPYKKIAELSGFLHPEYMHVVFKKEMGVTPGQFRGHRK